MKAVILCGGRATRLHPLTDTLPKSLIPVAGRPFILHQLDLLVEAGLNRVILCAGHLGWMIRDKIGTQYRGLTLEYSFDGSRPLGTAGAIRQALPLLGKVFFVIYGDMYLPGCDYNAVAHLFFQDINPGLLTIVKNDDPRHKNNVEYDQFYGMVYYNKRFLFSTMKHIDYGLSILTSLALDNNFTDLADVYHELSVQQRLGVFEMTQPFYSIGSHEGLLQMQAYVEGKL